MIRPIPTPEECAKVEWDVVIIGAGPAGSLAAFLLAREKLKVLLVDRQVFPRPKVCGCCLNGNAVAALEESGLAHIIKDNKAVPLNEMCLGSLALSETFSLQRQMVISRERLDFTIILEAINAGASFLEDTQGELGELENGFRQVLLKNGHREFSTTARVVIAADGLGGRLLVRKKITSHISGRNTRIGAGVILESAPDFYRTGKLFMACGKGGYLGLVRLEDGRLDLAAAMDPTMVKKHGSIGLFAKSLIQEMGWPVPDKMEIASWRGTPTLTGHIGKVFDERLFVVGDSAGYIEPFTGEGMAWALSGAKLVAPLVVQAVHSWDKKLGSQWQQLHRKFIKKRQLFCRFMSMLLKWPRLVQAAIVCLKIFPSLSSFFVSKLDRPSPADNACQGNEHASLFFRLGNRGS
jgi:flavin-dependent dehydrogenase